MLREMLFMLFLHKAAAPLWFTDFLWLDKKAPYEKSEASGHDDNFEKHIQYLMFQTQGLNLTLTAVSDPYRWIIREGDERMKLSHTLNL